MKKKETGFIVRIRETYYRKYVYRIEHFETEREAKAFADKQSGTCEIIELKNNDVSS